MVRSVEKTIPPAAPEAHLYNAFVATVQPIRIELTSLSAEATISDTTEITVQVESRFSAACPKQNESGFTAEARLELRFVTDTETEVAHVRCTYRLEYQADMSLGAGMLEQFAGRNVPTNVWPFMRELVMSLTLRFGWTGFVMPSFFTPARGDAGEAARAGHAESTAIKKTRKAKAKT